MEKKINASVFGLILFLLLSNPCRKILNYSTDSYYSTQDALRAQEQSIMLTGFPTEATTGPAPEETEPPPPTPLPTHTPYPTFTLQEDTTVTITLVNKNCKDEYFFMDGQLLTFIKENETTTFTVTKGELHTYQPCKDLEKQNCGDLVEYSFEEDTTFTIWAHSSCE